MFKVGSVYKCKMLNRPKGWNELGQMDFALKGYLLVVGVKTITDELGILDLVKFEGKPYWAFESDHFAEAVDLHKRRIIKFNNILRKKTK